MRWYWKLFAIFERLFQPEYKFVHVHDLPEYVDDNTIYIVGEDEHPWLLAFNCPCGCQKVIQLNLLKEVYPCWDFKFTKNKKINISPSIRRTSGCKSHFYVRQNQIDWVRNYQFYKDSKPNSGFNFKN
jgi:hypothetical protein